MKLSRLGAIATLVLVSLSQACGGGARQADNPDDKIEPFDDSDTGKGKPSIEPASSAEVKEGMDAIQAGDFATAKTKLAAAEQKNPKDPQAAYYHGVALEGLKDVKGAREKYEKALSLDPKLSEASVNLSALMLDAGDNKGALDVVKKGLARAPSHPGLLLNHALALEANGDTAGALSAYGAAVKAQPDNLEARYAYAELLAGAGKKDEAITHLRKVTSSDDPNVVAAAANVFGKLGAFAECVAAFDKLIAKTPTPDAHTRRGVCRHEMKDDPGAKTDFDAAIKLDPKFAAAHYYLGMHHKAAGKTKDAQASLEKAVELTGGKGVGEAAQKELAELKGGAAKPPATAKKK